MIDSGNLFGDLISEKLAKLLKLPIFGKTKTVGTASNKGNVTILGKTKPFQLYLEGIVKSVQICPYVVRDLSHPINLGQDFLRRHQADMSFRKQNVQLKIFNSITSLTHAETSLTKNSIDSRIKNILDKFDNDFGANPWSAKSDILDLRINSVMLDTLESEPKSSETVPGVFYASHKKNIEFDDTYIGVSCPNKTLVKAGHTTTVLVQRGNGNLPALELKNKSNDVYFRPKQNHTFLNRNMIFVHPGVYHRSGNYVKLQVTNFSHIDKYIPKYCHLGHILEANKHIYSNAMINELNHKPHDQLSQSEWAERRQYIIDQLELDSNPELHNHSKIKEEIIKIFLDNWDAVSISEYDFGKTDAISFDINIPKGTTPVRDKVRPLNPHMEADLRRQIDAWLEAEIIEPSNSPWASALVACKKKDSNTYRWCVDFRAVNSLTIKDAYPLSNIESNLHKLSGTVFYSCLDSAGAFHAIPIQEHNRDYTTFTSPFGNFRFCRLPFGLANAPACYSRLVQMALDRLPRGFALAYIDDIICYSKSLEDHVHHLRQIIEIHVEFGMKLNMKKCKIAQTEVEYLGHLVSKQGVRMIPSYVEKILAWPLPKTGKELRSFLGFCGYYRIFIKEFAELTAEMNKMKNKLEVKWEPNTIEKFERLKACFASQPVRGYPLYNSKEPFILDTDYSATGMAAVLSQIQNGKEVFLGCCTKKCNKAESNYPSVKGEMGALILGLKKFEHILRAKPFIIRTDSKPVEYLNSIKECRGIYMRWQIYLNSFQFKTVHRAGTKQVNADKLSRVKDLPDDNENLFEIDPNEPMHDVDNIYSVNAANLPKSHHISTTEMAQETLKDVTLSTIFEFIQQNTKPDQEQRKGLGSDGISYVNVFECLSIQNGIIYFQEPIVNGKENSRRMCLPMKMYDQAFMMSHADSSGSSGHFGIIKTFEKMKAKFYFPNMFAYVTAKVNNCISCITKRSNMPKPNHLQHREMLSYFGQRVYIDCVGPLTPCKFEGKICKHFLTVQDGFTRWLQAYPIPDLKTDTIADVLIKKWICLFGVFEKCHSDNGTNFTSEIFQKVMAGLGITKTFTPIYTPSGNRCERAHRILGDVLRSDNRFLPNMWADKLPAALLAYNSTVNRVTGVTPFQAVFGHNIKLPIDLVFPFSSQIDENWTSHIGNLRSKLSKLYHDICVHQKQVFMRENMKYQGKPTPQLQVGDTVFYFMARVKPNLSKKLTSRWIGPWEIIRRISDSLVVISPRGNWCKKDHEMAVVVNRLKRVDFSLSPSWPNQNIHVDQLEDLIDNLDLSAEVIQIHVDDNSHESSNESILPHPPSFLRSIDNDRDSEYESDTSPQDLSSGLPNVSQAENSESNNLENGQPFESHGENTTRPSRAAKLTAQSKIQEQLTPRKYGQNN